MSARPWRIEVSVHAKDPKWIYISSAASRTGAQKAGKTHRHWWPAVRLVNRETAEIVNVEKASAA